MEAQDPLPYSEAGLARPAFSEHAGMLADAAGHLVPTERDANARGGAFAAAAAVADGLETAYARRHPRLDVPMSLVSGGRRPCGGQRVDQAGNAPWSDHARPGQRKARSTGRIGRAAIQPSAR